MAWASLRFLSWRASFCLKDGSGTAFCLKRRCLLTDVPVGLFQLVPPLSLRCDQIRVGCKFIGSLFRSLSCLLGGLARCIPGGIGSHLCRLRHVGWLQCGHGLSTWPLESCLPDCLDPLLGLLEYPSGAITALAKDINVLLLPHVSPLVCR